MKVIRVTSHNLVDRSKMVLKAQSHSSNPVVLEDRHIDQVGCIDNYISHFTVSYVRMIKMHRSAWIAAVEGSCLFAFSIVKVHVWVDTF